MGARIAGMVVAILWGGMLVPASAQSLGEVARKEAARREQIKTSGKVLTNADLPASAVLQPGATEASEGGAEPSAAASSEEAPAGAAKPKAAAAELDKAAAPRDDEDGWRQRAAVVNKALAEVRAQVRQLRALSDRLSLEMQASDPAVVARATRERQDVKSQLATVESREADAAAARQAFEQEARIAGVPPAWIQ